MNSPLPEHLDYLPIILAIEQAANKSWDDIVKDDDMVWISFYLEEVEEYNNQ